MWKVLGPLILLVVVLLFQLQLQESFVTSTTSDASGNITDASGTVLKTSSASTAISLTLADLLSLFKASTPSVTTSQPSSTSGGTTTTMYYSSTTTNPTNMSSNTNTMNDSSSSTKASSLSSVDGITNTMLQGSPYTPAQPIPNEAAATVAPCSDSAAQGVEFQNALQDYIKKDEIPCYGCTL